MLIKINSFRYSISNSVFNTVTNGSSRTPLNKANLLQRAHDTFIRRIEGYTPVKLKLKDTETGKSKTVKNWVRKALDENNNLMLQTLRWDGSAFTKLFLGKSDKNVIGKQYFSNKSEKSKVGAYFDGKVGSRVSSYDYNKRFTTAKRNPTGGLIKRPANAIEAGKVKDKIYDTFYNLRN